MTCTGPCPSSARAASLFRQISPAGATLGTALSALVDDDQNLMTTSHLVVLRLVMLLIKRTKARQLQELSHGLHSVARLVRDGREVDCVIRAGEMKCERYAA